MIKSVVINDCLRRMAIRYCISYKPQDIKGNGAGEILHRFQIKKLAGGPSKIKLWISKQYHLHVLFFFH